MLIKNLKPGTKFTAQENTEFVGFCKNTIHTCAFPVPCVVLPPAAGKSYDGYVAIVYNDKFHDLPYIAAMIKEDTEVKLEKEPWYKRFWSF